LPFAILCLIYREWFVRQCNDLVYRCYKGD